MGTSTPRRPLPRDARLARLTARLQAARRLPRRPIVNTAYDYDRAGHLVHQTSDLGQDLTYAYDAQGRLTQITDAATGTLTRYGYDVAGRKISEYFEQGGVVYQDSSLGYDELGRLVSVSDTAQQMQTSVGYDAMGNRKVVKASFIDDHGAAQQDENWYRYDEMNRVLVADGRLVPQPTTEAPYLAIDITQSQGVSYRYDTEGNRTQITRWGDQYPADGSWTPPHKAFVSNAYAYDARNRLLLSWQGRADAPRPARP